MRTHPFCFVHAALLLSSAFAQTPGDPSRPAAPPEIHLQSLQLLTTESVYSRQPLAAERPKATGSGDVGTAAESVFAAIRDAEFDAEGRLLSLIVEAPTNAAANPDKTRRVLPATSVQWDGNTKRWLTADAQLAWASLGEFAPAAGKKQPASTTMPPRLASELLGAVMATTPAKAAEAAVEASQRKGNPPRIVWWLSPAHQQLAFAVVPHGNKHLPIPWSLLRTKTEGGALTVHLEAPPSVVAAAPTCTAAEEPPTAAVRQECYRHFGANVPKWDRAHDRGDKEKDRNKDGREVGKDPLRGKGAK